MMRIQAVIFDCDGVLADSEPAWAAAERELCLAYGIDLDQSPRVCTKGVASSDSVRLLMPDLPADEVVRAERLLDEIALRSVPRRVRPMPGAVALVSRLAEVMPVGVASNTPRAILEPVLSAIGVAPFLTAFVGADEVPHPKPAPHVYLRACLLLGSSSSDVLVVEDSDTGIVSAKAAGCTVIQVGPESSARHGDADASVPSLDAFWAWFAESPH